MLHNMMEVGENHFLKDFIIVSCNFFGRKDKFQDHSQVDNYAPKKSVAVLLTSMICSLQAITYFYYSFCD